MYVVVGGFIDALDKSPLKGTTDLEMSCIEVENELSSEVLALKQESMILRQSSNPVCGFSLMEQVRLCVVWHMES